MRIRRATESDVDAVQTLSQMSFEYDSQFDSSLNMNWSVSSTARKYFCEKISRPDCLLLVAESDGRVVGFLTAACDRPDTSRLVSKIAELDVLFVEEPQRSRGVGGELVKEFRRWAVAQEAKKVRVVVSSGNLRAADFYRRHGFGVYTMTLESDV